MSEVISVKYISKLVLILCLRVRSCTTVEFVSPPSIAVTVMLYSLPALGSPRISAVKNSQSASMVAASATSTVQLVVSSVCVHVMFNELVVRFKTSMSDGASGTENKTYKPTFFLTRTFLEIQGNLRKIPWIKSV